MPTKTVTLQPGESKEVVFTYTPTEAGSYQAILDGLVGSFNVLAPEPTPPEPTLIELVIYAPDTIGVGVSYSVRVTARNVGDSVITFHWRLGINYPSQMWSGQLQLEPGEISEVKRSRVTHTIPGPLEWWIAAYTDDTEIARVTKQIIVN